MRPLLAIAAVALWACGTGGSTETLPAHDPLGERPPIVDAPPIEAPLPVCWGDRAWQPGFHQALRWEVVVETPTVFRVRVPVGRAGDLLRFAFRSGDGDAILHEATVALAGEGGRLASAPVPITFGGAAGFEAGPRERVLSDPIPLPVAFREELYVSFEAEGHLAAGAIDLFPDSYASTTARVDSKIVDERREHRAIALASILVHGRRGAAVVAIGDSITEAFVDGRDDYRRNWPQITEALTGIPVANAAVSGQGLWGALHHLEEEVLALDGVTDRIVLLGTNDLGAVDEDELADDLAALYDALDGFCRVWAATLPPKDRPDVTDEMRRVRREVNEWIRGEAEVAGVIDFERVLADPEDPDRWAEGLDEDGIHPSVEGQRRMGEEAARFLEAHLLADE